ncbi:Rhs element Vgr protein [Rhodobacteraceae bacterium KLH11]|nr:Rhs element Vgr protein [Rhodobacteraceae bacterium KLH11]
MNMLSTTRPSEAERAADGFSRGLALGVVTTNDGDPEGLGRVRVKLELYSDGQESFWARVAAPMAGGDIGFYTLPDVGDEVLVGFIAQDPTHPVVLGGVWNGQKPPPETNGDGEGNDRKVFRTRKMHELRFDDGDAHEIELLLADGPRLHLTQDFALIEDANGNKVEITSSGEINIEASQSITLSAPTVKIDAQQAEVSGSANCKVSGALVEIN